jgi:site-specific DNA-methyltransferase (adenine-specific)
MFAEVETGECLEVMRSLDADCVDAIVTDPPYGLAFMGKSWDHAVPGPEFFAEMLRVAKPGAHLLSFGGTRLYHRTTCAIEDAGWEVRDCLMWLYGSGFPKSHNGPWGGTALKPAWEPIVLARKPLVGTVAANVTKHGTGGMNIDGCRIPCSDKLTAPQSDPHKRGMRAGEYCISTRDTTAMRDAQRESIERTVLLGRWPANLVLDEGVTDADWTRYFYSAKANKKDRGEGNHHPTVKPTDLMRWLCRLITPEGGTVLDPFCGSGSTGKAAVLEGFDFVGIEREAEYAEIARARIADAIKQKESK